MHSRECGEKMYYKENEMRKNIDTRQEYRYLTFMHSHAHDYMEAICLLGYTSSFL